jgi:DNA-binding LacI/PurR family transcriptional regulator
MIANGIIRIPHSNMHTKADLKTKHRQLSDVLRNRLLVEKLRPGDRFLSVREIAEKYDVSLFTSYKSVQNLAQQNLLVLEQYRGCFVAEGVRTLQDALAKPLITVLTPESVSSHDMIATNFLRGIRERLPWARVALEYLPAQATDKFLEAHINTYVGGETRAYVLRSVDVGVKRFFADRKLPAVVTGNLESSINLPAVSRDERQIVSSVMKYLIGKRHRHIGLIAWDAAVPGNAQHVDAFVGALMDARIIDSPAQAEPLIRRVPPFEAETIRSFKELLALNPRPTAVILSLEGQGAWALRTSLEMGIRIPQELALVSLEGGVLTQHLFPRMTNMPRNDFEIGAWVGNLLVKILNGDPIHEREHLIPVSLEERATT